MLLTLAYNRSSYDLEERHTHYMPVNMKRSLEEADMNNRYHPSPPEEPTWQKKNIVLQPSEIKLNENLDYSSKYQEQLQDPAKDSRRGNGTKLRAKPIEEKFVQAEDPRHYMQRMQDQENAEIQRLHALRQLPPRLMQDSSAPDGPIKAKHIDELKSEELRPQPDVPIEYEQPPQEGDTEEDGNQESKGLRLIQEARQQRQQKQQQVQGVEPHLEMAAPGGPGPPAGQMRPEGTGEVNGENSLHAGHSRRDSLRDNPQQNDNEQNPAAQQNALMQDSLHQQNALGQGPIDQPHGKSVPQNDVPLHRDNYRQKGGSNAQNSPALPQHNHKGPRQQPGHQNLPARQDFGDDQQHVNGNGPPKGDRNYQQVNLNGGDQQQGHGNYRQQLDLNQQYIKAGNQQQVNGINQQHVNGMNQQQFNGVGQQKVNVKNQNGPNYPQHLVNQPQQPGSQYQHLPNQPQQPGPQYQHLVNQPQQPGPQYQHLVNQPQQPGPQYQHPVNQPGPQYVQHASNPKLPDQHQNQYPQQQQQYLNRGLIQQAGSISPSHQSPGHSLDPSAPQQAGPHQQYQQHQQHQADRAQGLPEQQHLPNQRAPSQQGIRVPPNQAEVMGQQEQQRRSQPALQKDHKRSNHYHEDKGQLPSNEQISSNKQFQQQPGQQQPAGPLNNRLYYPDLIPQKHSQLGGKEVLQNKQEQSNQNGQMPLEWHQGQGPVAQQQQSHNFIGQQPKHQQNGIQHPQYQGQMLQEQYKGQMPQQQQYQGQRPQKLPKQGQMPQQQQYQGQRPQQLRNQGQMSQQQQYQGQVQQQQQYKGHKPQQQQYKGEMPQQQQNQIHLPRQQQYQGQMPQQQQFQGHMPPQQQSHGQMPQQQQFQGQMPQQQQYQGQMPQQQQFQGQMPQQQNQGQMPQQQQFQGQMPQQQQNQGQMPQQLQFQGQLGQQQNQGQMPQQQQFQGQMPQQQQNQGQMPQQQQNQGEMQNQWQNNGQIPQQQQFQGQLPQQQQFQGDLPQYQQNQGQVPQHQQFQGQLPQQQQFQGHLPQQQQSQRQMPQQQEVQGQMQRQQQYQAPQQQHPGRLQQQDNSHNVANLNAAARKGSKNRMVLEPGQHVSNTVHIQTGKGRNNKPVGQQHLNPDGNHLTLHYKMEGPGQLQVEQPNAGGPDVQMRQHNEVMENAGHQGQPQQDNWIHQHPHSHQPPARDRVANNANLQYLQLNTIDSQPRELGNRIPNGPPEEDHKLWFENGEGHKLANGGREKQQPGPGLLPPEQAVPNANNQQYLGLQRQQQDENKAAEVGHNDRLQGQDTLRRDGLSHEDRDAAWNNNKGLGNAANEVIDINEPVEHFAHDGHRRDKSEEYVQQDARPRGQLVNETKQNTELAQNLRSRALGETTRTPLGAHKYHHNHTFMFDVRPGHKVTDDFKPHHCTQIFRQQQPDLFDLWEDQSMSFCNNKDKGYYNELAYFQDIIMDMNHAHGRHGGEEILSVLNQPEEDEYYQFSYGFFKIKCQEKPNYFFQNNNHNNQWLIGLETLEDDNMKVDYVSPDFTIAITRYEYANIYHTMTDFYNAFLIMEFFNKTQSETNILIIDGHPKGALDSVWPALFNSSKRISEHPKTTFFKTLAWGILGYNSPMMDHYAMELPLIEEFRTFFLGTYNTPDSHKMDCDHINILFIWRHDYLAHPRNPKGTISRKIQNEQELVQTLRDKFPKYNIRGVQIDLFEMQQQLQFISQTDILIGMHGAGLTHAMFLSKTSALIELLPVYWSSANEHFQAIARWRHLHYERWTNTDPMNESPDFFTVVPPEVLNGMVEDMVHLMCKEQPTEKPESNKGFLANFFWGTSKLSVAPL